MMPTTDERGLEDLLDILRAWDAGREIAAAPASIVGALAVARTAGVSQPVAEVLSRSLDGPARDLLLTPVLETEAARAAAASAQLAAIGALLSRAGLEAVALKGAAFLVEAGAPGAAWRPMIDLDLLVPRASLSTAVRSLQAAGYHGDDAAHVPTDYHYPALMPPVAGLSVELHVDLGWRSPEVLEGLAKRSVSSGLAGLRAPTPDDRLAHLVHHAQIADFGYRAGAARLRDALDWRVLTARRGADPAAVRARFAAKGLAEAFDSFHAFAAKVWAEPPPSSARARDWVDALVPTLVDAEAARRRRRRVRLSQASTILTQEILRAHMIATIVNPARLKRVLRRLLGLARRP